MRLNGLFRDARLLGDVAAGVSSGYELKDLPFARGEFPLPCQQLAGQLHVAVVQRLPVGALEAPGLECVVAVLHKKGRGQQGKGQEGKGKGNRRRIE